MKVKILLIFLFSTFSSLAQVADSATNKISKVLAIPKVSIIAFGGYSEQLSNLDYVQDEYKELFINTTRGINKGLQLRYFIGKKHNKAIGLWYSQFTSSGSIGPVYYYHDGKKDIVSLERNLDIRFLGIQYSAVHNMLNDRFFITGDLSGGTVFHKIYGKDINGNEVSDKENIWTLALGAGVEYRLLQNLGVYAGAHMVAGDFSSEIKATASRIDYSLGLSLYLF